MKRVTVFLACVLALSAAVPAAAAGAGVIKLDEATFEVAESAGSAVITVERSNGEDGAVTVQYATSDGTATAGQDYTAVSGTLSWADGDGAPKTFAVPILDDGLAEGAETVHLTLSAPTGGATLDPVRFTSDLVILASGGGGGGGGDDDAGEIKFEQSDFQVLENGRQAVIAVERSHGEGGAVSVDYATSDGTATAGKDYTATSGTLSWNAGEGGSKTFLVPIRDDQVTEGSETVRLTLSHPTGGAVLDDERSSAVLTLLEGGRSGDDPEDEHGAGAPGTFRFDDRSFQGIEGGTARVVVERSMGEHGAVSVRVQTADGSAHAGQDYSAVSTVLTWAAGDERPKVVNVPIADDSLPEGNETVFLTLSNPTGGAAIDPTRGEATLSILDDDGSTAACVEDDDTLCLAGGRFEVEVHWQTGQGQIGHGHGSHLSDNSGTFWFFDDSNTELLIKVLDACQPPFNAFWVFFAATTDVGLTVTVTDTRTGLVKQYGNPAGRPAQPVQDTFTFATCGS